MATRYFLTTTAAWLIFLLSILSVGIGLAISTNPLPVNEQKVFSPLSSEFSISPAGTVALTGNLYYTAQTRDGGGVNPITNPLPRVRIEVWDDTGTQALATTWAYDNSTGNPGFYFVNVPNNEPGGIDPYLKVFVEDFESNPAGNRVQVVDENGDLYQAVTPSVGTNLQDGQTYP
ncbi:MAG: hypothetical protein L0Y56_09550, partial [Nitrospira sp.]|nr:hypothetical protein [Nitrospira sp.]